MQTDEEIEQMMAEINEEGSAVEDMGAGEDDIASDQQAQQSAPASKAQPRTTTPNIDGAGR
jgi:hypothetical protein